VLDAPEHQRAELIDGELRLRARPTAFQARSASAIGGELVPPFNRGRGGPGGWTILYEPELHLGAHVLVPDLAGWRRETLPELLNVPYFSVRPDWVAEVLSPSTQRNDRVLKLPIYREHGVGHVWLVDPMAQTLEIYRLQPDGYLLTSAFGGDCTVRAEPFAAIELDLSALWQR